MIAGLLRQVQGWVRLRGNTDDTLIGNIGDRLKVDSATQAFNAGQLHYMDLNASTGGIARGASVSTTFVNLLDYSGSGYFYGFLVDLEAATAATWYIRIVVDGSIYPFFGSTGLAVIDTTGNAAYDLADAAVGGLTVLGLGQHDNTTRFETDVPIAFSSRIQLQVKKEGGNKKFLMGYTKVVKLT